MNVLFWGLGGVGQRHLRNFHSITNGIHSYYTIGAYKHKSCISDSLVLDPHTNLFDLFSFSFINSPSELSNYKIDISVVSTPSIFHYDHAKIMLKQGSHLYLEKPAALSPQQITDLIHIKNRLNLKVSVVSQFRYNPLIKRIKSIISSDEYGPPLFVESVVSEYMPNWHPYEDYRSSYASNSSLGGGVVFTQIHEIDYLYQLFGKLSVVQSIGGKYSDLEIDVEDTCLSFLIPESNSCNFPIYLRQDYLGSPPKRYLLIQFNSASILCDFISLTLTISSPNQPIAVEDYSSLQRNHLFVEQLTDFINSIDSGKASSFVSLEESFDVVTIAANIKKFTLI